MKEICGKAILVVDDDVRMLRALEKVLTSEGAIVTCTVWAGDAIEILTERKKDVDLVITDLRMPFVSGLTAVFAIHQIYPSLPIIVLTAFGSPVVREECLRQGAVAFLEKPLESQVLLEIINQVFRSQPSQPAAGHLSEGQPMTQNERGTVPLTKGMKL